MNLTFNHDAKLLEIVASEKGKYNAGNAGHLVLAAIDYAEEHNHADFNKFSFRIADANGMRAREDKALPLQYVKDALNRGEVPYMRSSHSSGPFIVIAGLVTSTHGAYGQCNEETL